METNSLRQLIDLADALRGSGGGVGASSNAIPIVWLIVAATAPTLAALAAWLNSRVTTAKAIETAATAEKIHQASNSERTAMLAKVEQLRDEILALTKDKATLDEQRRLTSMPTAGIIALERALKPETLKAPLTPDAPSPPPHSAQ